MTLSYAAKAAKGLALVNADLGESWVNDFDLDNFWMHYLNNCVLGQAYRTGNLAGYSRGLDTLFGNHDPFSEQERRTRNENARDHGFDADTLAGYKSLEQAWRKLITEQKGRQA